MSTFTDRLAIIISADGKGAVRELDRVGKAADRSIGSATSQLDRFGDRALKTGTVMVGAAAVIGVGLASTVKSAQESERAHIRLQNTIAKMPLLAGANIKAFDKQASAIQRVTVAADEDVTAAQAMLGTFQLTQRQLLQVTPLVVDFARKFNVDLVRASIQVGKAFEGQIGALQRQGISIDKNLYKTDRYAAVMKALREQAGGFAELEGKTFEGQLKILGNQMDEFKESIGRGVIGVLNDVLPVVNKVGFAFGGLDEETGGAIGKIATIGTVTLGATGGLLVLAGAAAKTKLAFAEGGVAAGRFGTVIKGVAGIGAAVAAIFALKAGVEALGGKMQVTGEGWVKLTRDLAGGSRREMDVLVRQLERARDAIGGDPVGQAFDAALQQSAQSAQALVDALKRAGYDTSEFQSKVDAATASEARAADAADAHSQKVDELRESEREAAAAIEARIGATIASFDSNLAAERGWVSLGESIAAASEEEDAHKRQLELTGAALDQAGLLAKSSADNYEKLTGETATAEQEQQFFRSALEQVAARFPELAPLILGYIGQLDSIPPGKHTTVTADTSQAELGLRRVGDQLRYIGEHGSIVIKGPGIGTEGKAAGGPVRGHVPIVVGERGPELFVPSTAGQIVPNHALASTGGRALGGGITYQIAVNVAAGVNPAEVGRQTVEAIRAYERRSGAAWRNN